MAIQGISRVQRDIRPVKWPFLRTSDLQAACKGCDVVLTEAEAARGVCSVCAPRADDGEQRRDEAAVEIEPTGWGPRPVRVWDWSIDDTRRVRAGDPE